jgi:hypothetical protein
MTNATAAEPPRAVPGAGPRDAAGATPSALVFTTQRWLSTARVGLALSEAGFEVSVVCPDGHPLRQAEFPRRVWRNGLTSPLAVLRVAIIVAKPDLIVPCDERAVAQLVRLHAVAGGDAAAAGVRTVIERSLAAREHFPILQARAPMGELAAREGASTAETLLIEGSADLSRCAVAWGFPMVLKSDGSSGGAGIRIVRNPDEAARAFRGLGRPPPVARATWRAIKHRDAGLLISALRRERSAVSAQRFVHGIPANMAAACWRGEVLAAVGVEAVRTAGDRGPATVVRRVDSPEMSAAVAKLAERLELSGLCGFDFMRDESDGRYYLIEVNARATPTCHLAGADGVDLSAALRAAVAGARPPAGEKAASGEIIALFPQEMLRDPNSPYLTAARHDVPSQAGFLVRAGWAALARRRRWRVLARYLGGPDGAGDRLPPGLEEAGYRPAETPA